MRTKITTSPATRRELRALGARLRESRLRRELPQQLVADRACVTRQLVARMEKGDPGVAIGSYALVLQALGLISGWGDVQDTVGEELAEAQLRRRAPRERREGAPMRERS
jgi:transcriptional regulator with XRE-family HTH domain